MTGALVVQEVGAPGTKGLKANAIGFLQGVVIGVASTAPAYSLAATLGFVVIAVGLQSPAIMWLAFIPMACIAASYYYLNRVDPDAGTSFSWVTKAMGPWLGWLVGWAIIIADIVVMADLAEIASIYSYRLFGIDTASFEGSWGILGVTVTAEGLAILAVGVLWIVLMTVICYLGIQLAARTQLILLTLEILALGVFAVAALWQVYAASPVGAVQPSLDWLNPFAIAGTDGGSPWSALAAGMVLSIFIYWGWDSTVSVNEETENPTEAPGKAAVVATVVLLLTYVVVTVAAQAFHGAEFLSAEENQADVLGALARDVLGQPLDMIVIIAILSSAAASTQTTILPTARTALSMGAKGALPGVWARMSRFMTPSWSTIGMGVLSIAFYVVLKLLSENILYDAIAALGLQIAFYYGLTGYACVIFFRHELRKSVRNFVMIGIVPLVGALVLTWALIQSAVDLADPANSESGQSWLGFGPPDVIAFGLMLLGAVLMILWYLRNPTFFRQKPGVVDPAVAVTGAIQAG